MWRPAAAPSAAAALALVPPPPCLIFLASSLIWRSTAVCLSRALVRVACRASRMAAVSGFSAICRSEGRGG
jgi:hypothetical protein